MLPFEPVMSQGRAVSHAGIDAWIADLGLEFRGPICGYKFSYLKRRLYKKNSPGDTWYNFQFQNVSLLFSQSCFLKITATPQLKSVLNF